MPRPTAALFLSALVAYGLGASLVAQAASTDTIAFRRSVTNVEYEFGPLSKGRVREILREPEAPSGRWYGFVVRSDAVDAANGVPGRREPYAVEYAGGVPVRGWFDASGDGDLTDDPPVQLSEYPPIRGARSFLVHERWTSSLAGKLHSIDRTLRIVLEPRHGDAPPRFHHQQVFAMVGEVPIDGRPCRAFLYDGNGDGLYTPSFGDGIFIDEDGDRSIVVDPMSSEFGTFTAPFHAGDALLEAHPVDPSGVRVEVTRLGESPFPQRAEVGAQAPPFEFVDTEGRMQRLSDYRGRFVLVYFWASWCGTCAFQARELDDLLDEYPADRLAILGVSYDEERSKTEESLAKKRHPWPTSFTGKMEHENTLGWIYRADAAGILYLLDPRGTVLGRYTTVADVREALATAGATP